MSQITEITSANFESAVLKSPVPVLVDFWSPQCGPCRMLVPTLEQLAAENEDDYVIAKCNVFENTSIAAKYSVDILPTLLFFNNGDVAQKLVGVHPKDKLQDVLEGIGDKA